MKRTGLVAGIIMLTFGVAGSRIFTAGMMDKTTHAIALGLKGKPLWRKPNGESWQATQQQTWAVPYAGSRGTPTVDGEEWWSLDLLEVFQAASRRSCANRGG